MKKKKSYRIFFQFLLIGFVTLNSLLYGEYSGFLITENLIYSVIYRFTYTNHITFYIPRQDEQKVDNKLILPMRSINRVGNIGLVNTSAS